MVNFIHPSDYLFGTSGFDKGSEQGGIYNRNFRSVRIEEYPADLVAKMDRYFVELQERGKHQRAKFSLLFSPLYNMLSKLLPNRIAERGNCARYVSMGLVEAGLITRPSMWPKNVLVNLFERWGLKDPNNVNMVSYRRIPHAKHSYGTDGSVFSGVKPLHPLENLLYFNLERFASIIVEVPEGTTKAKVIKVNSHEEPSWWRYHRNISAILVTGSLYTILRLLFKQRHAIRCKTKEFLKARNKNL